MTDFWLALTAVGTLVLGAATAFLAWQTRASVKLGREQTSALREQAAAAREELDELRRERREDARPVVRWELIDSWAEARAMGQDDLIYGVVRCKVVNYGGHALVSNLDFTERPQVDTEPRYVRELLPTGRELPILFRFGPFRRDLTSTARRAAANAFLALFARMRTYAVCANARSEKMSEAGRTDENCNQDNQERRQSRSFVRPHD